MTDPVGTEVERAERLDQVAEGVFGQLLLVRPGDVAEDQGEAVGVRLLDALEHRLEGDPDVLGYPAQIAPVTAVGDLEAVVLGQRGEIIVAAESR